MEYVIVTYRSRNISLKVYNYLQRNLKLNCALVSTPRAANVGCGLSVRISQYDAQRLGEQLANIESFAGIFSVRNSGGKTVVVRW